MKLYQKKEVFGSWFFGTTLAAWTISLLTVLANNFCLRANVLTPSEDLPLGYHFTTDCVIC